MNKIIEEAAGEKLDFVGYIDGICKEAIADINKCLKNVQKQVRKS